MDEIDRNLDRIRKAVDARIARDHVPTDVATTLRSPTDVDVREQTVTRDCPGSAGMDSTPSQKAAISPDQKIDGGETNYRLLGQTIGPNVDDESPGPEPLESPDPMETASTGDISATPMPDTHVTEFDVDADSGGAKSQDRSSVWSRFKRWVGIE